MTVKTVVAQENQIVERKEIMKRVKSLMELTGQESGVVIYNGEERNTLICNWSHVEGLPKVFGPWEWIMGMGEDIPAVKGEYISAEDVADMLDNINLIYDANNDIQNVRAGILYRLPHAIVIAPEGWN